MNADGKEKEQRARNVCKCQSINFEYIWLDDENKKKKPFEANCKSVAAKT